LDLVDIHEQLEALGKAIPEPACGVLGVGAAVADEYLRGHREPPGTAFSRSRAPRPGKLTQLVTNIQDMKYLPDTDDSLPRRANGVE
jgi:hypothetical protein